MLLAASPAHFAPGSTSSRTRPEVISGSNAAAPSILIITVEGAAAFEPLITSGRVRELVEPGAKWAGDAARSISAVDYVRAMQTRRLIQLALDEMFEKYDLLISPTMPILAAPLADSLEKAFSYADPVGSGGNLA